MDFDGHLACSDLERDLLVSSTRDDQCQYRLFVAAELRGEEAAQTIQLYMAYAPEPPFNSGTPETAPPPILERARQSMARHTARREETARRIAAKLGIATAAE